MMGVPAFIQNAWDRDQAERENCQATIAKVHAQYERGLITTGELVSQIGRIARAAGVEI